MLKYSSNLERAMSEKSYGRDASIAFLSRLLAGWNVCLGMNEENYKDREHYRSQLEQKTEEDINYALLKAFESAGLDNEHRSVVEMRNGLTGEKQTLTQVGEQLFSGYVNKKEKTRQEESRALRKLNKFHVQSEVMKYLELKSPESID